MASAGDTMMALAICIMEPFNNDKEKKDSVLDNYEELKREIIREKANKIFRNHPKNYVAKLEELGFTYYEDDDDSEEIEEKNAKPENRRQKIPISR